MAAKCKGTLSLFIKTSHIFVTDDRTIIDSELYACRRIRRFVSKLRVKISAEPPTPDGDGFTGSQAYRFGGLPCHNRLYQGAILRAYHRAAMCILVRLRLVPMTDQSSGHDIKVPAMALTRYGCSVATERSAIGDLLRDPAGSRNAIWRHASSNLPWSSRTVRLVVRRRRA